VPATGGHFCFWWALPSTDYDTSFILTVSFEQRAGIQMAITPLAAHIEAGFLKISINVRIVEGREFGFMGR